MERKAVVISGSPRPDGNTDFLATLFAGYFRDQDYLTKIIYLRNLNFSSCIGCEKCRNAQICAGLKDDLTPLYPELLSSELWVLGTPVHNYNVSAWMKAFIDRLYCFYHFTNEHPRAYTSQLADRNIHAFVYGIGEQLSEHDFGFTIEAMEKPLEALGISVVNSYKFFGYFAKTLREDSERLNSFQKQLNEDFPKILGKLS